MPAPKDDNQRYEKGLDPLAWVAGLVVFIGLGLVIFAF